MPRSLLGALNPFDNDIFVGARLALNESPDTAALVGAFAEAGRFVSGHTGHRPVHVVVADNEADHERIIVTVYQPDPMRWTDDFRTRRRP